MDAFAATCEAIAATSSRLEKVRLASEYLASLGDDIGVGACFLSAAPFPRVDARRTQVGVALLLRTGVALTGWDAEVVRSCVHATGDIAEAIGLLAVDHVQPEPFSLKQARLVFDDLAHAREQARKLELLLDALRRMTPRAVKAFLSMLVGELRIGLQEKQVEEAIALATGQPKEAVRAANVRSGDIESVALAARQGTLGEVRANLFHPIDFMLASPLAAVEDVADPSQYLVEHKFDGIRAQVHVGGGRVAVFSRGLGDVTASFPEVSGALRGLRGPLVLDGEIVAVEGGRTLPFVLLQKRLSRRAPSAELQREIAVAFIAYDLLHDTDGLAFERPIEVRREALARVVREAEAPQIRLSHVHEVRDRDAVERLFEAARESGDEGLVLKRRGSTYEPGRRGSAWLKLKRALGTLDVVITAAEQGHGQRASMLSDYTFAVRDGDLLVNVGKAYTGLTDEEIVLLTRRLQALTLERFGHVRIVRPEIVLEVAFDTVQKSSRHKSGYALRFPRIVRMRDDKFVHEIDTLQRVAEIYERSINTGRVASVTMPPPVRKPSREPGTVDDLPLFASLAKEKTEPES